MTLPEAVVWNYNPNGGCRCFREDCSHSFSDDDRKAYVPRRCATCNEQIKQGEWYKVGEQAMDGVAVDDTEEVRSGVAHASTLDCVVCYSTRENKKQESTRRP